MKANLPYETTSTDSLAIEYRCVKDAPKFSQIHEWGFEEEQWYWGTDSRKENYFLVRNPALMTRQCAEFKSPIIRQTPRPVIFAQKQPKKKSSWNEMRAIDGGRE